MQTRLVRHAAGCVHAEEGVGAVPVRKPVLEVDVDGRLWCPLCQGNGSVHVVEMLAASPNVSGRPPTWLHVGDATEVSESGIHVPLPVADDLEGPAFVLGGWCEQCAGRFVLEFAERQGHTHARLFQRDQTGQERRCHDRTG